MSDRDRTEAPWRPETLTLADSLREMGYIAAKPGRDLLDWTLLEEVIAENRSLWNALTRKSVLAL